MIARYKKSIDTATAMLHLIRENSQIAAGAIVDFQMYIIRKIKDGEKGITQCKEAIRNLRTEKANHRPSRERSKEIDHEIDKLEERRENYKYIIYIWKCYGDGVAFHFCDKYALKHLLYDDQYRVKETAGFLSGKEGLRNEIRILKAIAKHDVPAVLCDVTNTLRHGDICLLAGNDPSLIEIKSSPKINKRGEKQIRNMLEIQDFFKNDKAENFRNKGITLRREHIGKEKNYVNEVNGCITRSYSEGTTFVSPEKGISYVAVTDIKDDILDQIKGKYLHVLNLNDLKRSMSWHPYTPFTLLLNPEHVYNFIQGNFTILVFLDLQVIKRRYKKAGMDIKFLQDINWYAQISEGGDISKGAFRVSEQSFLRLAFEFQSLTWVIRHHKKELKSFMTGNETTGTAMEIPKEWFDVADGIPL